MQCKNCLKDFEAKRSTAKYCSAKCRKLAFQGGPVIVLGNGKQNAKVEPTEQIGFEVVDDVAQAELATVNLSDRDLLAHWAAGNGTAYQQSLGVLAEQYSVIESKKNA